MSDTKSDPICIYSTLGPYTGRCGASALLRTSITHVLDVRVFSGIKLIDSWDMVYKMLEQIVHQYNINAIKLIRNTTNCHCNRCSKKAVNVSWWMPSAPREQLDWIKTITSCYSHILNLRG